MNKVLKNLIVLSILCAVLCQPVLCGASDKVTLYAADNRTIKVSPESVSSWLNVGWYTEPVSTLYAADGRTITVGRSKADAYKAVGWYAYPVTYVYKFDGSCVIIAKSEINSYLAAGWLDKPANSIYNDTIRNLCNRFKQMDFDPYPSYTTYDINKDGIPELIYNDGMYEAARQFHVYTYMNGNVVFVGSHGACHGYVASYPHGNGMLIMGGHMGYETIYFLQIINGRLVSTLIQEKDTNKTGEEYSEPWQIARGAYQLDMTRCGW